jgi:MFS transporter, SHS family, lactate transporter
MLRDQRLWRIAALNAFAVGTLLAVQGLWGAAYLADVQRLEPLRVGNLMVVMGVGVVIGNLSSGALADRVGRRRVVLAAGSGFTACHALLMLLAPGASTLALAGLYLAFGTLGSFGVVLFAHARAIFPGTSPAGRSPPST